MNKGYTIEELMDKGVATLLTNKEWLDYICLSYENKIIYLEKLGVILPPKSKSCLKDEFLECHV